MKTAAIVLLMTTLPGRVEVADFIRALDQQATLLKGVVGDLSAAGLLRASPLDAQRCLYELAAWYPSFFPDNEVPFEYVLSVALVESGLNPLERGTHGERGFLQVMDWRELLGRYGSAGRTSEPNEAFCPDVSVRMGLHVLRYKWKRYKNVKKTIMAYNGLVRRGRGWDQTYYKRVLAVTKRLPKSCRTLP